MIILILSGLISSAFSFTVIAHRGASGHLPEHTLAAAALAHGLGADYIEADLVMTKDDHLVVLHDTHLDTTTDVAALFPGRQRADGRFYAVDFTLTEIKRLQARERFNPVGGLRVFASRFSAGESGLQVPTFDEFVTLVKSLNRTRNKDVGIYVEIKKPEFHQREGKDITRAVHAAMKDHGYEKEGKAYLQCFWPESLRRLKSEFKTRIPLVQLIAEDAWKESSVAYGPMLSAKGIQEIASYAQGIGPRIEHLLADPKLAGRAKAAGLLIHPYTHRRDVTGTPTPARVRALGVDGVFTDFVDDFVP